MTKVLTIQGCKDCPYMVESDPLADIGGCSLFEFMFENETPSTPHPNCRLNDLPDAEDFTKEAEMYSSNEAIQWHFNNGANYVLNKIKK